ncbi:A/G-specific adenine glycosylase [Tannerella sp.]|uniref:A/G-specific adenine glycosylase n=1 Tax=Tannerella sp. TaxID=2382127 RepID=UPI0026DCBCDB|nr:A/G-specific adenine glycosylase [Tannerella sp.]MDO4702765.1 A/G-specific adenine glycosylase [Tannerella sp.]
MKQKNEIYKESEQLRAWYRANKRDLPWRNTSDPYRIWISEVILQQTRVAQGLDYYYRFIERFPDVESLAEAPQEEVLKYWQGLGYYSRARNLHEAAKDIRQRFGGVFPSSYEEIRSLKGIGEYTAAAIASFAWNLPYPAIDGNVIRVLGRLFAVETPADSGKGKSEYRQLATLVMPPQQAGEHNQALMEFGALHCIPRNPDCTNCPMVKQCAGHASGNPHRFPVKQHKTKTRDRFFHYFFITHGTDTYLHQRTGNDIWKGLFELPMIETETPADLNALQETPAFGKLFQETGHLEFTPVVDEIRHILSHQILHAACYIVKIEKENTALKKLVRTTRESIDIYPFPKLIINILSKIEEK